MNRRLLPIVTAVAMAAALPLSALAQWTGAPGTPPNSNAKGPVWLQTGVPTAQSGKISITEGRINSATHTQDLYMTSGKAIRTTGAAAGILNFGNYDSGATSFTMGVSGNLNLSGFTPNTGQLTVTQICLTGDSCRTTWPGAVSDVWVNTTGDTMTGTLTIQNGQSLCLGGVCNSSWPSSGGTIGGSGSANYVPKFTGGTTLGNSGIYDDGTSILIGGTSLPGIPSKLMVRGDGSPSGGGVWGWVTNTGVGVGGTAGAGDGVYGAAQNGRGVFGVATTGYGVYGASQSLYGVYGSGGSGVGVYGRSNGVGVQGQADGASAGVFGNSVSGQGIYGQGVTGVQGNGTSYGLSGSSASIAVYGSGGTYGVYGRGTYGVVAENTGSYGFYTDHASNKIGALTVGSGLMQLSGSTELRVINNDGSNTHLNYVGYGDIRNYFRGTYNFLNGTTYITNYAGSDSDIRKKDLHGSFDRGLDAISALDTVYFTYKKGLELPEGMRAGVVAQDIQKVIPEAVNEDGEGYLHVSTDPVVWTMVNAIKELKAENDALKARLDKLEAE